MFCAKCGERVVLGEGFCVSCGSQVRLPEGRGDLSKSKATVHTPRDSPPPLSNFEAGTPQERPASIELAIRLPVRMPLVCFGCGGSPDRDITIWIEELNVAPLFFGRVGSTTTSLKLPSCAKCKWRLFSRFRQSLFVAIPAFLLGVGLLLIYAFQSRGEPSALLGGTAACCALVAGAAVLTGHFADNWARPTKIVRCSPKDNIIVIRFPHSGLPRAIIAANPGTVREE